jgi:AhpD family alkylhydroperoxidase
MRTDEHKLSLHQRELVAVGASVGAGCHPCVSHHIRPSQAVTVVAETNRQEAAAR